MFGGFLRHVQLQPFRAQLRAVDSDRGILVYVFDCTLDPLYVILLALFNDVTMIPVAEDTDLFIGWASQSYGRPWDGSRVLSKPH